MLIAGCQNAQSMGTPVGPLSLRAAHAPHAGAGNGSWMAAEAKHEDLVYVSDIYNGIIDVYEYGKSKQVGALRGFDEPTGQCVDRNGDVWIIEYFGDKATEFAHGQSKPIRVLTTNGTGQGCSINPKNGDLAIGNTNSEQKELADIQVFKKGSNTPTNYYSAGSGNSECDWINAPGYDDEGNLFFLASWGNGSGMCELPAKAQAFVQVPISTKSGRLKIRTPGSTMWDGKHITFEDFSSYSGQSSIIYRAIGNGSGLNVVGSTTLGASSSCDYSVAESPFIVGNQNTPRNRRLGTVVIGGNMRCQFHLSYWSYPAGGAPFKETYGPGQVGGASVSLVAK